MLKKLEIRIHTDPSNIDPRRYTYTVVPNKTLIIMSNSSSPDLLSVVKSDYSSLIVGLMTDVLDEVDLSEYQG